MGAVAAAGRRGRASGARSRLRASGASGQGRAAADKIQNKEGVEQSVAEFKVFTRSRSGLDRLQAVYKTIFKHFGVTSAGDQRRALAWVGLQANGPKQLEKLKLGITSSGWRSVG